MDSGLSTRSTRALEAVTSKTEALPVPGGCDPANAVDLASAQNEVIYKELSEFFGTTIEKKLQGNVFAIGSYTETLRVAMTTFFNTHFHPIHPVKPEHIVPTAGCRDALESLLHSVCEDGDSVLVPGPYWFGCESLLKSRSNINIIVAHPPSYVNHDNYLLPSLQAAFDFSADKARIKAVVLTNPHNPLSRCYPKKALVECMEFCQEHGLHLVIDEIFGLTDLKGCNGSPPFVSALSLTEPLVASGAVKVDPSRVHIVWSASKLFGLSGMRIGCVVSQQNPQLCKAVGLLTTAHVNSIAALYISSLLTWSQLPTLLALNSERLTESYSLLVDALRQWDVKFVQPTHGILLFAKLAKNAKTAREEQDFYDRLAVHGVWVSPGRLFNGVELEYGWARLRFSVPLNTMRMAVAQISTFLAKQN